LSNIETFVEKLKETLTEEIHGQTEKHKNLSIKKVYIGQEEVDEGYERIHYYTTLEVEFEREETEKEEKKRLKETEQAEIQAIRLKEKKKLEKMEAKKKEYDTYLKLKEKFEK
jgi:hypothetical protein